MNEEAFRKDKQVVSTLECKHALYGGRKSGRTTKQTDFAIQHLFRGSIVKVEDHYQMGHQPRANKFLMERILKRLEAEFDLTEMKKAKRIRIDQCKLELELLCDKHI